MSSDVRSDVYLGVRLTRPMRERIDAVTHRTKQTPSALARQGLELILAMHEEKTR
jgi:hypothetical protein